MCGFDPLCNHSWLSSRPTVRGRSWIHLGKWGMFVLTNNIADSRPTVRPTLAECRLIGCFQLIIRANLALYICRMWFCSEQPRQSYCQSAQALYSFRRLVTENINHRIFFTVRKPYFFVDSKLTNSTNTIKSRNHYGQSYAGQPILGPDMRCAP